MNNDYNFKEIEKKWPSSAEASAGKQERPYDFKHIEQKWQKRWEEESYGHSEDFTKKPKHYHLVEFPYPSGAGLHVGHCMGYGASDAYCRMKRMQGYNVMYPIGWDAFGLPTENYAIKHKIKPAVATKENVDNFKKQMKSLGLAFDWDREINTTDSDYYKWTQWIFLQFYKHAVIDGKLAKVADDDHSTPRLAFQAEMPVNWCPSCKVVLANEEVIGGNCERCGTQTEKRKQKQWMLRITAYAERLIKDLDTVDYLEKIKTQQINWIGKSQGVILKEKVKELNIGFEVYDSVPQTFIAQTFTVIAPEHPMVEKLVKGTKYEKPVLEFVERIGRKKQQNKFDLDNDLEGIFTGRYVDNPFGTGDLPIWVASYVLADYGTGIVNCSAHDERDFNFAKKYGIPLKIAMLPKDEKLAEKVRNLEVYYGRDPEGIIQAPDELRGLRWVDAKEKAIELIVRKGYGTPATQFKLRDWIFSRQHYWGEPIPVLYCEKCGEVPIPEDQLPVMLPDVENYEPTDTGESPLAKINDWVNTTCPKCGGKAKRETDTMPNWAGSSWYYNAYAMNQDQKIKSEKKQTDLRIDFKVRGWSGTIHDQEISVLTSRVDTLFGCTYIVLSPEHPLIDKLGHHIQNFEEVKDFIDNVRKKFGSDQKYPSREHIGVKLYGVYAMNPINDEKIDIWVADYILPTDGTGAIMAVPAHDERDWEFAKKHELPIKQVIAPFFQTTEGEDAVRSDKETVKRKMVIVILKHWRENKIYCLDWEKFDWHSFVLGGVEDGESGEEAAKREAIEESGYRNLKSVEKIGFETHSSFFARHKDVNRYSMADCYVVTLGSDEYSEPDPEHVKNHKGKWIEGAKVSEFINLPSNDYCWNIYRNGEKAFSDQGILINSDGFNGLDSLAAQEKIAERLRQMGVGEVCVDIDAESTSSNIFADNQQELKYWMPVDLYNGGMEHTTLHLLYSRFWHKFLYDLGVVSTSEPYAKRIAHGIILGPDGRKMSKSFGNVINPDDIANKYGADTLRAYIMFIGPYDQESAWSMAGVQGVYRFLKRVWLDQGLVKKDTADSNELLIKLNQTIQGVSDDLENFHLNTYIAKLMELNNVIEKNQAISRDSYEKFLKLLFPAAPHIASEIWELLGLKDKIEYSTWPTVDEKYLVAETIEVVVQVNGKVRERLQVKPGLGNDELKSLALESDKIKAQINGKEIIKTIVVPNKLVSIVIKER